MKGISVSFIIPYYKVDIPLLARAVKSVQDIGDRVDWELWVVDDGTPESEAETFLLSLGEERIHYYAQPNSGPGGARNAGLSLASKEYVFFLDADDCLFTAATRQALKVLESRKPELLAIDFRETHSRDVPQPSSVSAPKILFEGSGVDFMLHRNLRGSVWGYFFRKSILGDLRFTHLAYHEDEEFTALLYLRARHVVATNIPVYAYFQRIGSIMHHTGREFVAKRYEDMQSVILRLMARCHELEGDAAKALTRRTDMLRMAMVYTLLGDSPDSRFLHETLGRMQQAGLYPLAPKFHTPVYTAIRIATLTPWSTAALSRLFRSLRIRHAGHAS